MGGFGLLQMQQGRNIGDAAVRAGVKLLVWSGGERIGSDGMDNKANIEVSTRRGGGHQNKEHTIQLLFPT